LSLPAARWPAGSTFFSSLAVPYFLPVWASGGFWALSRWFSAFLTSYLVTQLTGSPLLVQLTSAAFFFTNLCGGLLAGVLTDRWDPRRTCIGGYVILLPFAAAMAAAVLSGHVQVWMVYPFMLAMGLGQVMSTSVRVVLVHDLVGDRHMTNALVWEYFSLTAGSIVAPIIAGAVIQFVGIGQAFTLAILSLSGGVISLLCYPASVQRGQRRAPAGKTSLSQDLRIGLALLRENRALVSLLGVTAAMNLFFFPYVPLVPVFAQRLDVSPLLTGLLVSAAGMGTLASTAVIASRPNPPRGWLFCAGSMLGLAALIGLAAAPGYPLAFFSLVVAGVGVAGFGSMQSALTLSIVPSDMRGRAMGLVSVVIGLMPFGLLLLGILAQIGGPPAGLILAAGAGLALLLVAMAKRPDIRTVR